MILHFFEHDCYFAIKVLTIHPFKRFGGTPHHVFLVCLLKVRKFYKGFTKLTGNNHIVQKKSDKYIHIHRFASLN